MDWDSCKAQLMILVNAKNICLGPY